MLLDYTIVWSLHRQNIVSDPIRMDSIYRIFKFIELSLFLLAITTPTEVTNNIIYFLNSTWTDDFLI